LLIQKSHFIKIFQFNVEVFTDFRGVSLPSLFVVNGESEAFNTARQVTLMKWVPRLMQEMDQQKDFLQ